jgi:hypothetical protein
LRNFEGEFQKNKKWQELTVSFPGVFLADFLTEDLARFLRQREVIYMGNDEWVIAQMRRKTFELTGLGVLVIQS